MEATSHAHPSAGPVSANLVLVADTPAAESRFDVAFEESKFGLFK
jgi:hypothetical protein